MWRVGVGNRTEPQRIEIAGGDAFYPALDFKAGRLAFHRSPVNFDIWRLELDGKPAPFLTSSLDDRCPQYSPDGRSIAFSSGRRGDSIAIWVANADGTGVHQITRMEQRRAVHLRSAHGCLVTRGSDPDPRRRGQLQRCGREWKDLPPRCDPYRKQLYRRQNPVESRCMKSTGPDQITSCERYSTLLDID